MDDLSSEAAVALEGKTAKRWCSLENFSSTKKTMKQLKFALEVLNTRYLEEEPQLRL